MAETVVLRRGRSPASVESEEGGLSSVNAPHQEQYRGGEKSAKAGRAQRGKFVRGLRWLARPGFTRHASLTGGYPFYRFNIVRRQLQEVKSDQVILDHPAFRSLSEKQRYQACCNQIKGFDQATFEAMLERTLRRQSIIYPAIIILFAYWYLTAGLSGLGALFFGVMCILSSIVLGLYWFASYVYLVCARKRALIGVQGAWRELVRGRHGK